MRQILTKLQGTPQLVTFSSCRYIALVQFRFGDDFGTPIHCFTRLLHPVARFQLTSSPPSLLLTWISFPI